MAIYSIKQADGQIIDSEPIPGCWYCHFEIIDHADNSPYVRDGQLAQYIISCGHGSFVDEYGEDVPMVSLDWPCYIVLQN